MAGLPVGGGKYVATFRLSNVYECKIMKKNGDIEIVFYSGGRKTNRTKHCIAALCAIIKNQK